MAEPSLKTTLQVTFDAVVFAIVIPMIVVSVAVGPVNTVARVVTPADGYDLNVFAIYLFLYPSAIAKATASARAAAMFVVLVCADAPTASTYAFTLC